MKKLSKSKFVVITMVLVMVLLSFFYYTTSLVWLDKSNGITIVVDAGHGGRDGGSVGVNGTIEKEINLAYALALKEKLIASNFNVVLTRANDDGLYSEFAKNKKVSDMNARMQIIKKANPSLVISIHMNSFSDSSVRGANCYYKVDDEASKNCADLIQKSLKTYCDAKNTLSKEGDYFMLNCSYYTSVLIECGFISNPEEEKLLNTEEYKNKMIDAIFNGVILYYGC